MTIGRSTVRRSSNWISPSAEGLARSAPRLQSARRFGLRLRLIPFEIKSFQQLACSVVSKMCDKPRGLVLVTGPTGSGKSTTLAAMIDKINPSVTNTSSPSRNRSSSCT